MIQKLTPILRVEAIEPCLSFWVERLGFTKVTEVLEGDQLGFVILSRGHVEIILQSRASLAKDIATLAQGAFPASILYVGVTDFEELERRLEGAEIVVPKRETFYGATEIWVRDPAGHVIGFAAA